MQKKIPQRTCMACQAKKDKRELVRIVRSPEGEISVDVTELEPRERRIDETFAELQRTFPNASDNQSILSAFYEALYVFTVPNIFYMEKPINKNINLNLSKYRQVESSFNSAYKIETNSKEIDNYDEIKI